MCGKDATVTVVRVLSGIVVLGALIGVPGWLTLRLLLHATPAVVTTTRTRDSLLPIEWGYLGMVLGIGIVGPVALVLAMLGVFSVPLVVVIIAVLCIFAAMLARIKHIPLAIHFTEAQGVGSRAWYRDRDTLAFVALLATVAVLFLHPGETLLGDGDAGVYYETGVAIAHTGGIRQYDVDLARIAGDAATVRHLLKDTPHWRYRFLDGVRLTGFFAQGTSGAVMPQFMHLWGAWLAIFAGLFGVPGPAYAPPLCGLLGVAGVTLLGRRLFGWPVGLFAGVFLALNGIEVWFVRQTYTEPFQQFALLAALFGFALLESRRDADTMRVGAIVSAVALGSAALIHIQTLFLLPVVIGYALVLWLMRAWRPAHTWFFAVFGSFLALMAVNIGFFAFGYAEAIFHNPINKAWALRLPLAVALVVSFIVLVVVDRLRARWLPLVIAPRTHTIARAVCVVAVLGYAMYTYLVRPGILTGRRGSLAAYIGAPTPTGNAANLVRLGWYWSPLGILLVTIGAVLIVATCFNRRVVGLLAVALVHTAIFVDASYAKESYLYALRRDVPVILPAFALFAAYAVWQGGPVLASVVHRVWRQVPVARLESIGRAGRVIGSVAAVALVLFYVATRAGTWTVQRFAGVEDEMSALAAKFPANSLLLFTGDRDQPHILAAPLTYVYGRSAFVISTENPRSDLLEAWLLRESATRPVYVLMGDNGGKLFPPHVSLVPDAAIGPTVTVTLRDFEALQVQKPHNPQINTLRYTVYRFQPPPTDQALGPLPHTITVGAADERYEVQGFYPIEQPTTVPAPAPYRWTGPSALVRVPWTPTLAQNGGTLTLRLAGGKRPANIPPAHVLIAVTPGVGEDGLVLGAADLPEDFTDITIHVPPGVLSQTDNGTALIRIDSCANSAQLGKYYAACSAWSPQDFPPVVYDARVLGVQVQSLSLSTTP